MDKNSEIIIRTILSDVSVSQKVASLETVTTLCKKKMPEKIFNLSINQLIKDEYITLEKFNDGSSCILPLYKTYNYFENKRKERIRMFIIPAIISVITNLIISALKWLLPPLLQLVSSIQ